MRQRIREVRYLLIVPTLSGIFFFLNYNLNSVTSLVIAFLYVMRPDPQYSVCS